VFAQQEKPYEPWIWHSEPPEDCPFEQSTDIVGVAFTMNYRHYKLPIRGFWGDTWYPSWASNDTLYSPWTDGQLQRLDGSLDYSQSGWVNYDKETVYKRVPKQPLQATTGQAAMIGTIRLTCTYSVLEPKTTILLPTRDDIRAAHWCMMASGIMVPIALHR
jgi:hypothetical protein